MSPERLYWTGKYNGFIKDEPASFASLFMGIPRTGTGRRKGSIDFSFFFVVVDDDERRGTWAADICVVSSKEGSARFIKSFFNDDLGISLA